MKNNIKSLNGITLIALIITIIVLLILAGVTLAMVMGDSGIFGKAQTAKEQTMISQYKEKINLIKTETRLKNNNELTLETLKSALDEDSQKDWVNNTEIIDDNGTEKIKLTTNDAYVFLVTEKTTEYKGVGDVIIDAITAEMVEFTPKDSNWKDLDGNNITNIKQALDSLYDIYEN